MLRTTAEQSNVYCDAAQQTTKLPFAHVLIVKCYTNAIWVII